MMIHVFEKRNNKVNLIGNALSDMQSWCSTAVICGDDDDDGIFVFQDLPRN